MDTRRDRSRAYLRGALLGAALALPGALAGQDPDTAATYRMDSLVVSVGREEVRRGSLPRQIDVVTRTDIERTPAENVAQVLKKQATLDVIEFPGLLSGVGIRGFRPQYSGINQRTLVLIDGRPAGATNLSLLEVQSIERIEVLKGPASSLYGSNAMGGVVNLVTRRSTGPLRSNVTLGYGSWNTRQASVTTGGGIGGRADFDASLAWFDRRGDYRSGDGDLFRGLVGDDAAMRVFADSTVRSPELGVGDVRPFSEFATRSGSLRLGGRLAGSWRADGRVEGFRADHVENPGDLFYAYGDSRSLKNVSRGSGDLSLTGSPGAHNVTARVFTTVEEGENFNVPTVTGTVPRFVNLRSWTRWRGAQVQDALRIGDQTVIAGVDYTRAQAESERFRAPGEEVAPYEPESEIRSTAFFAEGRFRALDQRLVATLGGRLDRVGFEVHATELWDGGVAAARSESFTVFNPSFGVQYTFESGVRVHGGGGRAFVTPSAFNVAAQVVRRATDGGVHLTLGNPQLDPENSLTLEAGVGILQPWNGVDADITYFRTRVDDRIATLRTTPTGETAPDGSPIRSRTTYVNADEAEMDGVEWRLSYDLGARAGSRFVLRPYAGATHMLRAEEVIGTVTRDIRNVAELTVNFGVDLDNQRGLATRLSGRYVGERADDDFNVFPVAELRYPAFLTLDWTGEARVMRNVRLGVLLSNLTDEYVYEVRGYPLPGRAVQLRLSVDF